MRAKSIIFYLTCIFITIDVENVSCKATIKIIGGHPISIRQRPFMLSLHNSDGFICGASILSKNWGITALHCLLPDRETNYFVRAGSNKLYQGGSLHKLTKIYMYNNTMFQYWFSSILYHDIALFEVRPRFRFSSTVRAVRLPTEFSKPPQQLCVCGWGYTSVQSNAKISDVLMGVCIRHTPYETCIEETPEYRMLVKKDYHLCYGASGKDSCYGDSGGPLASKNTIYGIVSFGQNCAIVSGVYTKVSYYRRWIKQITNL
ncbi:trypsin 3A1-like [Apis cerana]|uniref:trypsin 3A1-like n=1 Tax=Apis cerana TaxID=7461 RepID=UPI002B23E296|nr:trypsin 3A1-like [Apis cerana]